MFPFTRSVRPARAPVRRTILTLDRLDDRWMPDAAPAPDPTYTTATTTTVAPPQITDFGYEQIANGEIILTGKVIADNPAGLVVSFGGAPECVQGLTTTTASDGTFSILVYTTPDDFGTIWAQTVDQYGQQSDLAYTYLQPSGTASTGGTTTT